MKFLQKQQPPVLCFSLAAACLWYEGLPPSWPSLGEGRLPDDGSGDFHPAFRHIYCHHHSGIQMIAMNLILRGGWLSL
jgi:hypothetical protein